MSFLNIVYTKLMNVDKDISRFKVSRNPQHYPMDITQDFLEQGVYELDLRTEKTPDFKSPSRRRQCEKVNMAFERGDSCLLFIEDQNKNLYVGQVKSKFRENTTNPFYLTEAVTQKSQIPSDISHHSFYTCDVLWCKTPLSSTDKNSIKSSITGFLAMTIKEF